ncbi:MAG: M48 family metalloprotease [Gammaproteobacteria bacterium]
MMLLSRKPIQAICYAAMLSVLSACAVNPVTGQREISFISEQRELTIGQQQYVPSQQGQGGELSVDAQLSAYVQGVGNRLAAVSDRQLPYEFVVLNNSVPNAWALPGGKIAVNRGLLIELGSEAELAAVLGHEIVHAAARHGAQAMERGMLLQGAMVVGAIAVQGSQYADYAVGGAQLGAQLLTQRYGREAERESDAYGIRYMARAGYDPVAAINLQETFVRLSEGRGSSNWLDGLFASHPPSLERVQNNRVLVAQLRAEGISGGELGVERYQAATQFLRDAKPAYDAFDEAEELIAQDRLEEASRRLDTALSLVPDEARFLGLQADILVYQRRYEAAVNQYDRAIEKDSNYFDYYLGRGVAYSRQGQQQRATRDLQASIKLLPTALAMTELGDLSLQSNDRAVAKQYYQIAAEAQGAVGERSRNAFMQLDVADNPAQYVSVQAYVTPQGRLVARAQSVASIPVRNVRVEFRAIISGQEVARAVALPLLNAGQSGDVDSGLNFPAGVAPSAGQVSAQVTSASVD